MALQQSFRSARGPRLYHASVAVRGHGQGSGAHCRPELAHDKEGILLSMVQHNAHAAVGLHHVPAPLLACSTERYLLMGTYQLAMCLPAAGGPLS